MFLAAFPPIGITIFRHAGAKTRGQHGLHNVFWYTSGARARVVRSSSDSSSSFRTDSVVGTIGIRMKESFLGKRTGDDNCGRRQFPTVVGRSVDHAFGGSKGMKNDFEPRQPRHDPNQGRPRIVPKSVGPNHSGFVTSVDCRLRQQVDDFERGEMRTRNGRGRYGQNRSGRRGFGACPVWRDKGIRVFGRRGRRLREANFRLDRFHHGCCFCY